MLNNSEIYVNKDDFNESFYRYNYEITIGIYGPEFIVNAECITDAFDGVIDYLEENMSGLLFSREEELEEEFLDDYVVGGNHGRYISTLDIGFKYTEA